MDKFIFDKVLPVNTEYVKAAEELDSSIALISSIIKKYPVDNEKVETIKAIIKCVISREDNYGMTLGVKGIDKEEKSNIINDLIGDEVLKRSCAYAESMVIVRYGKSKEAVITFKNGKVVTYKNHGAHYLKTFSKNNYKLITEKDKIEEFINLFIETNELASELQSITIYNPANILKMGLVIINIPNDFEKGEMDKLVEKICDVFVLINSHEDIMYGSAAEYDNNKLLSCNKEIFINASLEKENTILKLLLQKKIEMQAEMLSSVIDILSGEISKYMYKTQLIYDKHHVALKNNIIDNLDLYVLGEKSRYSLSFVNENKLLKDKVKSYIEYRKGIRLEGIKKTIERAQSINELDKLIKTTINEANDLSESTICGALRESLEILEDNFKINLEDFKKRFKSIYKSLSTLGGRIEGYSFIDDKNQYEKDIQYMWKDPKRIGALLKYDIKKEEYSKINSYLKGALIGTAVFPVIGTLLGSIISKIFNSYSTSFLEEYKKDYFKRLESLTERIFIQIESNANKVIDDLVFDVIGEFENVIDMYFVEYKNLIRIMLERDSNEQIVLKQRIEEMKEDLVQLQLTRIQLNS